MWCYDRKGSVSVATSLIANAIIYFFVTWRKVCFGTQSCCVSLYIERMMTVAGNGKLQRRNSLQFITQALLAHWGKGTWPSLIPASAG